mgnify:CR=1 FL=1
MYKSEKQFTKNASKLPVEEIYTSVDLDRGQEWDPNLGFNFQYPQRWVSDRSQKKAIGIRRLQVTPSAHVIELGCAMGITAEDVRTALINKRGTSTSSYKWVTLSITSKNSLDEIMCNICDVFYDKISNVVHSFEYEYDYRTGELEMWVGKATNGSSGYFCMTEYFKTSGFLKFLNQEVFDDEFILYEPEQKKIFRGVWNRENLYFHTSFSNSKLHFLGINGDHFDNPSVFYPFSTNSNDFRVWFSTDLIHKIIPRHCEFILQLCFVMNVEDYTT